MNTRRTSARSTESQPVVATAGADADAELESEADAILVALVLATLQSLPVIVAAFVTAFSLALGIRPRAWLCDRVPKPCNYPARRSG